MKAVKQAKIPKISQKSKAEAQVDAVNALYLQECVSSDWDDYNADNSQTSAASPAQFNDSQNLSEHDFSYYFQPSNHSVDQSNIHHLLEPSLEDNEDNTGRVLDSNASYATLTPSSSSSTICHTPVNNTATNLCIQDEKMSTESSRAKDTILALLHTELLLSPADEKLIRDFTLFDNRSTKDLLGLVDYYVKKAKPEKGTHSVMCPSPYCMSLLGRWYQLKSHLIGHFNLKPHSCEFPGCKSKYSSKDSLMRHINSEHRGLSSECNVCHKTFRRKNSLKKHYLGKHNSVL